MYSYYFLVGHSLDSQWVRFAQVGLFRKGQLLKVSLGLHVGQIDALELLRIEERAIFQGFELLFNKVELFIGELHGTAFRACLKYWAEIGDASSLRKIRALRRFVIQVHEKGASSSLSKLEARAIDQPTRCARL